MNIKKSTFGKLIKMNRKLLWAVLLIVVCGSCVNGSADPKPEIVPQVTEPYSDFVIADGQKSHIWTDRPEHGWTVMERRSNRIGYKTNGRVQWLDKETHHILHRSFLPVWDYRDAYANMSVIAALSGDGSLIASQTSDSDSFDQDDKLYWSDTRTGAIRNHFEGVTYPFVFSPNGKYFVVTIDNPKTYKSMLSVYSVPNGHLIKTLDLATHPLFVLWCHDSKTLASIGGEWALDNTINLTMWSTENFEKIEVAQWHGKLATAFFDRQNDLQVLSEPTTTKLSTMELRSWKATGEFYTSHTITFGTQGDNIVGFPKDGSILMRGDFSEGSQNHFRYYLFDKTKPPRQLTPQELEAPGIANLIKLFLNNPKPPLDENDFAALYKIKALRVTNGKVLAADASHVFNILDGHLYNTFKPAPPGRTTSDISPNGRYFTSAGANEPALFNSGFWGLWNLKKVKPIWNEQFQKSSRGVDWRRYVMLRQIWTAQLAFSPNSKRVAMSGNLNHPALAVYDASNGHGIWAHPSDAPGSLVRHFDWSRNGRKLAVVMEDSKSKDDIGHWKVVDAKTGKVLQEHTVRGKLLFIAWCSNDTVLLARQTPDKYDKPEYDHPPANMCYLELHDANTGNLIRSNSQSSAAIYTMAVSANQKDVAVAYCDGSLRVWEIATGKLKLDKRSQTVNIAWRGNHQIVTAESDNGVKFWSIPQQKLLATALFIYPWKKDWKVQKTVMDDAQWLIYTPDNYYDCSPGAEKYIRWRAGDKLLPADTDKSTFHNRRKVMKLLNAGL